MIVCGHLNDRVKLERFLREFFHPTLVCSRSHIRVVLLSPAEPTEEVTVLLTENAVFANNVVYLVGSTLIIDDLVRAGAHYAVAFFFLGDLASNEELSKADDEATVLRVLSVSNYDSLIPTFVQLAKQEDRTMLESCDIDVLLCHDEFRTTLQVLTASCTCTCHV